MVEIKKLNLYKNIETKLINMDIVILKEKFKEVVDILAAVQSNGVNTTTQCLNLFKKGAPLYDELPEIEQILASLKVRTPEEVMINHNVIDCIIRIGRMTVNKAAEFKPVNLAKKGEETNSETVHIAWVTLKDLDVMTASSSAMINVLKDRLQEMHIEYLKVYHDLENLSRCNA